MDPRELFPDERNTGFCVYCGGDDSTSDHVPSKVLLDEPFPNNLPLVPACADCNNLFSVDEPYLACLIECVLAGSTDPAKVKRKKVARILTKRPHFAAQVSAGRTESADGGLVWQPDSARVINVIVKLARGHVAYELSEPQLGEPDHIFIQPFCAMTDEQRIAFESFEGSQGRFQGWPELGSRAFLRTLVCGFDAYLDDNGWQNVQDGRYRYIVSQGPTAVRMVLSEYLACEVVWE